MSPDRNRIDDVELAGRVRQWRLIVVSSTRDRWKSPLQIFNSSSVHVAGIQSQVILSEVLQNPPYPATKIQDASRSPVCRTIKLVDRRPDRHITVAARLHETADTPAADANAVGGRWYSGGFIVKQSIDEDSNRIRLQVNRIGYFLNFL